MDAATITALLTGLGGQIATGINQALVNGNNAGREGNGPPGRPPDFSDRHRPDTAAQILKSQQSAFDHVMENRADPDSQTITAFIQSVEEKLTSEHCKNVFKFRGYQSYIRQSNDLINACDAATERAMLALVNATTDGCLAGNFVHFGGNMAQDDLGDRQPMYFDGRTILPGRALVTQRKKDLRQLFGLEEQSVIIREYNSALFESCYAVTGTEADYRSNARPAPARPTVVLNDRHPSFVTLMEILDWRSRAAVHISADAFVPLRVGARAAGRPRITLVGAASTVAEDQALVMAFAFASPVAKNELYHAFHAANPSTIMPVYFGRNDAPTADDWKSEPLQFPVIPPLFGNITIRFHGRLYDGPTVRMIQDPAAVRRYPVLPQFDSNDPTGCFVPGRAMTEREYQTHDTAMLSLIKIGFEQRKTGPTTEKKAELSGWSDVTAIDSTLCFWATHEAVRIMKKHHMENFDTWESTLRDHIYHIQLHRNVRVTLFLESINKAQLLLDDLGAPRVDDATVYNLVVSQYLKLYLKINPRTDTDLLTMQYHKRAVIYRQRYDQTEPLDATDVEEHRRTGRHRTVAFMRDWKNLDAIKQAAKRDEELCTDEASSLPKYLAEYDIESQQPRSGHAKPKVAHVKITETGEVESALSLMSDILDGSPSDDVADAVSQIQHELLANIGSGPPQSLRGGPGGNRRFAMAPPGARPGPPTSRLGANSLGARANRPYYDGMHPSVRGGG
mgnify:FL=1